MNLVAVNDLITHRAATAHQEIEGAIGQTLPGDNLGQCPSTGRHEVRRLKDHGVTKSQRRRDFPHRSRHGKIPRADNRHNTHRLTTCLNLYARAHRISSIVDLAMHLGGKVMEELSRPVDFTDTLCAGFAFFAGQQFA